MVAPQPPALMDELVEECLLRLLQDDAGNFVRASLVCKGWRSIVTDHGFARRYRELHGRTLGLGFLHIDTSYGSFFMPIATSSFRRHKVNAAFAYLRFSRWHTINLRHGCVLLCRSPSSPYRTLDSRMRGDVAVWDPILGDYLDLPKLPLRQHTAWFHFTTRAAVLCASGSACDHLDCRREHFNVVWMDATYDKVDVYVYSSQAGAWSHQTTTAQEGSPRYLVNHQPVTMDGDVLYFIVRKTTNGILRYDIGAHEVSSMDLPPECSSHDCRIFLTTTEQGGLGIVRVEKNSRLHLWSREAGPNGVLGWAPSGIIELEKVLPGYSGSISTVAFVHGLGAFVITTNIGAFTVDLVSNRVRKVICGNNHVNYLVPHTSLGTPAFTGEEPPASVLNA